MREGLDGLLRQVRRKGAQITAEAAASLLETGRGAQAAQLQRLRACLGPKGGIAGPQFVGEVLGLLREESRAATPGLELRDRWASRVPCPACKQARGEERRLPPGSTRLLTCLLRTDDVEVLRQLGFAMAHEILGAWLDRLAKGDNVSCLLACAANPGALAGCPPQGPLPLEEQRPCASLYSSRFLYLKDMALARKPRAPSEEQTPSAALLQKKRKNSPFAWETRDTHGWPRCRWGCWSSCSR